MEDLTRCAFCGGRLAPLWKPQTFSRCTGCGLVLRNPFPSTADLAALYAAGWSDPNAHDDETGSMDAGLAREYTTHLIHSVGGLHGKRVLDFGAGKGALMEALLQAGADAYAYEPFGADQLRAQGKRVFQTLDEIPDGLVFDGIVSMDVAEHLQTPWESFAAARRYLKPGGWLLISTPNPRGLNARLYGGRWREAHRPGHIVFMSETTLAGILRSAGYEHIAPLRWHMDYRRGPLHRLSQAMILAMGLHGTTRLLARNPSGI